MTNRPKKPYYVKVFDALSQLVNTLIGGYANESLSGRAYRTQSKWEPIINKMFWFDPDHCRWTHLNDIEYAKWLIDRG